MRGHLSTNDMDDDSLDGAVFRYPPQHPAPRGVKLTLLTIGNQQVTGVWTDEGGYKAWFPLIGRDRKAEEALGFITQPTEDKEQEMGNQIMAIPLCEVISSNVSHMGHAGDTLRVRFKSGRTYRYHNVPAAKFEEILNAPSIGSHLAKEIIKHPDLYPVEEEV